jgi:hypothetical protein
MTPRLTKAIKRTAEFAGTKENEVEDMAAQTLERGLEQAEKQVKAKFRGAIKRAVTFGAGAKRGKARGGHKGKAATATVPA